MNIDCGRKCTKCRRVWTRNPITLEWTCFVCGRPDGSAFEKRVWDSH
jgi:hypothetical protein